MAGGVLMVEDGIETCLAVVQARVDAALGQLGAWGCCARG
jgi:hypothetical protein